MKVLIDPGHAPGNANRGQNGYREYESMWRLSNMLKKRLEANGVYVELSRGEDEDPPLEERGGKSKGFDLFISEHTNAFNKIARGVECFYSITQPENRETAARLSAEIAKLINTPDRGAKTREGDNGQDYYGVIRAAAAAGCPRIFLIESGFHDNLEDEAFLLLDDNLQKIAEIQADIILSVLED